MFNRWMHQDANDINRQSDCRKFQTEKRGKTMIDE